MAEKFILGVDVGTTGCRASLYSSEGRLVKSYSLEYPLMTPQAGWAEQDPNEIYRAFESVVKRVVSESGLPKDDISGLCFSTVLHSLIPVDDSGAALYPMLTWADSRSQKYTEKISGLVDVNQLYGRTGCPLHPMYPVSKILWLREERKDIFKKSHKFVSIKEFIFQRLIGKYVVDKSIASGTGLYDILEQHWDPEILGVLGIEEERLSVVYPTTHVEPELTQAAADSLGLNVKTPVILGAGDGVLSTLGAGAISPGQLTVMIGTSGAVRLVTTKPMTDLKSRNWCYNLSENLWVAGGAINNGGIALRWARDKFARTEQYVAEKLNLDSYDILSRYAQQKPPGADGLILLPFFSGERSPYWNANARGVLFGLNLNHGKRHLMRATFEGITYSLYSVFLSLKDLSPEISEIRASGNFTRSPFWVQIMADVFGREIILPGEPEGAGFGAAVLGMFALNIIPNLEQVTRLVGAPRKVFIPDMKNHERYQRLYKIYERVYWNLQKEFDEIAEIQSSWYVPKKEK